MNPRDPLRERPAHDDFMQRFMTGSGAQALKKIDRDLVRDGRQMGEAVSDAFIIFATTTAAAAAPINYTLSAIRRGAKWAAARQAREVSIDDAAVIPLLGVLPCGSQDDDGHGIDDQLYLARQTPAGKRHITNSLKKLSVAQRKYAVLALAGLTEEEIQDRLGRTREQVASMLAACCGEKRLPPAPRRRKKPAPAFLAAQQGDLLEYD